MNLVSLITLILFYSFLGLIWWLIKKKKIIPRDPEAKMLGSISEAYYGFQKVDYSAAFWIFCVTIGGLMILNQGIYDFKESTSWILIVSGTFLCFVGIAAPFRQTEVNVYHYTFSVITMTGAMAATITEGWPVYDHFTFKVLLLMLWALFPLAAYLASIYYMRKKKWKQFTTATETACFTSFMIFRFLWET